MKRVAIGIREVWVRTVFLNVDDDAVPPDIREGVDRSGMFTPSQEAQCKELAKTTTEAGLDSNDEMFEFSHVMDRESWTVEILLPKEENL